MLSAGLANSAFFSQPSTINFGFQILKDQKWGQYAWFYSSQKGDISQVAEVVHEFLKVCRPKCCFTLTWADYADSLTPEQFDGGALFVTAQEIKTFHAGECSKKRITLSTKNRGNLTLRQEIDSGATA